MVVTSAPHIKALRTRVFTGFTALIIVVLSALAFASIGDSKANAANTLTIPNKNYPIPSGAVYVNPNLASEGNGSLNSPYKTISNAISKTPAGGTIVLLSGVYREGPLNIYKKLTIQSYPGAQAWLDGSDKITNWVPNSNGGYRLDNSPSSVLCKEVDNLRVTSPKPVTKCVQDVSQIDFNRNEISYSPQMVFVNDLALKEVSNAAAASSGNNFYFDKATNSLYIGVDPNGKKVEVTTRRKAIEMSQSASGSSLLGIGIRRYGSTLNTNQVDGGWNFAAVQISGNSGGAAITGITIEDSLFTENASRGLYLGYASQSRITNNIFTSNGANGVDVNKADSITVNANNISSNNTEKFTTTNGTYAVIAGSKMVRLSNSVVKENIVENNDGEGFWCDLECVNVKYYSNVIRNNSERGIFYEVSTGATIASNIISNNGMGIAIHGPNSKIYNNTLYKNGEGIGIFEDGRTPPTDPYSDNRNNTIVNNIIYGTNAPSSAKNVFGQSYKLLDVFGPSQYADTVAPNQMVTSLNYNSYFRESNTAPVHVFGLSGKNAYQNFTSYTAAKTVLNSYGFESNGYASDNGTNEVLFIDATNNNFTVKSGSNQKNSAKLLNSSADSYIATDLGIDPNAALDRGAIKWPGKSAEVINTTTTQKPSSTAAPTTQASTTTKAPQTTTTMAPTTTKAPATTTTLTPTTTIAPTTTTTKAPQTTTTSTPPSSNNTAPNILAMSKIKADHDLMSIKQISYVNGILYARAYFKSSGFLYMAADINATITNEGNYTITGMNLMFNFGPFTY